MHAPPAARCDQPFGQLLACGAQRLVDALLEDYRQLPRSVEPTARQWEKWLKGGQATLAVTFDQETAAENPHAVHLSVLHPLMRQAARYLAVDEPSRVSLTAASSTPSSTKLAIASHA